VTKLPTVRLAASIVTVKNRALSPAAKMFIDCARQAVKEIASNVAQTANQITSHCW
jgi:hypothetical protein